MRIVGLRLLLALAIVASGCSAAKKTVQMPAQLVSSVVPGSKGAPPDPAAIQGDVLRYADDFISRASSGIDEYAGRSGTPKARSQALVWKLSMDSSAVAIATGPNPVVNLLDFVALASLTRAFLEQEARNASTQGAFDPWLENCVILETNAWKLAEKVFSREQQQELGVAIKRACEQGGRDTSLFFARPQEFSSLIHESGRRNASKPGSIFGLIGLDPTAGLDPAVREVTRTRLLAERALFAMQRIPFLVRWQTELYTESVLRDEQLTNTVGSVDRLSRAAESASRTVETLPDRLAAERKAIVDTLDGQEEKLRGLSAELHGTISAGEKMFTSMNTTLTTFHALMKRFGVGEPSTSPPDSNAIPFNINDYGRTAEHIAGMAKELDSLIRNASASVDSAALNKQVASLSGQAQSDAKSVLNHAFLLATGLIVLAFACALIYRRTVARWSKPAA